MTLFKHSYLLFFSFFWLLIAGCKDAEPSYSDDNAFAAYISAYTGGPISRSSAIRVVLRDQVVAEEFRKDAKNEWLSIEPKIDGELKWLDQNTLIFEPSEMMPSGTIFTAKLRLGDFTDASGELDTFIFGWRTYEQSLNVELTSLRPYSQDAPLLQYVSGVIQSNDRLENIKLEEAVSARQGDIELPISWEHAGDNNHRFVIDSIARLEKASEVHIAWDSKIVGSDEDGARLIQIPGLEDFDVVDVRLVQSPDQHVVVLLSDPIDPKQQVRGHFILGGYDNLRTVVEGNEVHLYPPHRISGTANLEIRNSLRSRLGYQLKDSYYKDIVFESVKPAVKMVDVNKTILPPGNKNSVAFQAVSLSAVDVRVIRIFSDNLHQFLQVNDFGGGQELKRVGRVIRRKTVKLGEQGDQDLSVWNTFFLDLDDLIKEEPGALYRVEVGFRKQHSLYPCDTEETDDTSITQSLDDDWDSEGEEENSYWDYFDSWYSNNWYDDDYDWSQRDNPCHVTYYRQHRTASRNIFSTDIGITAKNGEDGSWHAWVNGLSNPAPVSGAKVTWFNYQGQTLHQGTTNSSGHSEWKSDGANPFLVAVESNRSKAYLRVAKGESLTLARFDVSGATTQAGMKGMIYGERGVWRPGDTLFLSFMLQPGKNKLPENHPIKLELVDARGKIAYSSTRSLPASNHLSWAVESDDDAPTGAWQARVRVGNAVFNQWLRVETIKPNRLKIALDFKQKILTAREGIIKGDLEVKWLHGAIGRNLRTVIELGLRPMPTKFDRFDDFTFDDPSRNFNVEDLLVFDQEVDRDGKAQVKLDLNNLDHAPGMLRAVFNTRAFEPGGDFSTDALTLPLSPFERYVGVRLPKGDKARGMLLTDTTHTAYVQALLSDGRPAGRMDLDYEIYKVQWRWWWQSGDNDLASYSGRSSMELITSGKLTTDDKGEGQFDFKINYPDWGRYLVRVYDVEGGHACGKTMYVDWPGWAGRARSDQGGAETALTIQSDQELYAPGDVATITFPGADDGRALLTIENASGILHSEWIKTISGSNRVTLPIKASYAPNVFASLSLMQPHAQTLNDHPMRLYGTQRIKVVNPQTQLDPVIAVNETLRPEETYTVGVSESAGKPMSYTLAVVDEGLLGLTRFSTPNPHGHFYAQEVLGVRTWDFYDKVIGAYGKTLKGALSTGGDEGLSAAAKKKVNRFKPVVTFLGPFNLKKGEQATHRIQMPNYVGAVRVMVVARHESAYGRADQTVEVKKPLMVLATLPRVVGPGEEVELPVNVFAMEDQVKNVEIEVKHGGLMTGKTLRKKLSFASPGDQIANFKLETLATEGATFVEVIAKSGTHTARHKIEIAVRNPNMPVVERYAAAIEPGGQFSQIFDLPGVQGSNTLSLEVSAFRPINLGERLEYLIGYPHGCLEQTTSRAFPQLYLEQAVDLSEQQRTRVRQYVSAAVVKVQKHQLDNGGFAYWSGQSAANDWSTSYVGHFLLAAKEKGYNVPNKVIHNWTKYQDEIARNWRPHRDDNMRIDQGLHQAYRLYTLAFAGSPNIGAMNRLREVSFLSQTARWKLAAAYFLAGRNDAANALMSSSADLQSAQQHISSDYGSLLRDEALIAHAMIAAKQRTKAADLITRLSEALNSNQWLSTQETAFSLAAIGAFMAGESQESLSFDLTFNGQTDKGVRPPKLNYLTELPVGQTENNTLEVKNKSGRTIYVQVSAKGQPLEDRLPSASNGLSLQVDYLDAEGKTIDVTQIEQGTDLIARVKVSGTGRSRPHRDVALTQVFPSGWEIINERMLEVSGQSFESTTATYRDIRDDRVHTYFDLARNESAVFYVRLNATYLGRFFLPATQVEVMYEGTINARTKGKWVHVVPQGVL